MIIFLVLLPTLIAISYSIIRVFLIKEPDNLDFSKSSKILPSREIRFKRIKKHLIQNDAKKHDNEERHQSYKKFVKYSYLTNKIVTMGEANTRYDG